MTETLVIPRRLADEMIDYCLAGRPHEACGILARADGRVVRVFCMTNASASPVRYSLEPREQLAVYNRLDEEGWEIGGVFHSHTHTNAYPSPTDVRLAMEDVPYVIVSLLKEPAEIKAFRIEKQSWTDAEGRIEELDVRVVD